MADRTRPADGSTAARYQQGRSPWVTRIGAVVLAVVSLLAAYAFARPLAGSPQTVRFDVLGFDTLDDRDAVTIRWTVDRPIGTEVICVLRSRNREGAEVGRAEVPIPAQTSSDRVGVEYTIVTVGRPVTGEVTDCGPADG